MRACFALTLGPAAAQDAAKDFPSRSIKIVVPFPAGGPSDVLARLIGQKMTEDWGQPVVIENRAGANTVIGAQIVKQAPADGYTLLMAIDSTLTMNQYLYRTPPYDPINDFAPITLVAKTMMLLMVNSASEVKTCSDLIGKAKAQPANSTSAPARSPPSCSASCSTRPPACRPCWCPTTAAPRSPRAC